METKTSVSMSNEVAGRRVQVDISGVGHCWRNAEDKLDTVREEIAAEIINGVRDACADYLATNGMHYRDGRPLPRHSIIKKRLKT